jgi:hypothetical protein
MASRNEIVLLDINTLGWLYLKCATTPKAFNLTREKEALFALSSLKSTCIHFRYPGDHFHRSYYVDVSSRLRKEFPTLRQTTLIVAGGFARQVNWFIDALKEKGERQDDVELMITAAFSEHKRINKIVTFDVHLCRRIPSMHSKLNANTELREWIMMHRPDFFNITPLLPSELLKKYS